MGRITWQQIRVFGIFSVALVLSGVASVYALRGVTYLALAATVGTLVLVSAMVQEASRPDRSQARRG